MYCLFAARTVAFCPGNRIKPKELVSKAFSVILEDESFSVPTLPAKEALEAATQLVSWAEKKENELYYSGFAFWLVSALKQCFKVRLRAARIKSENIWKNFHQIRISPAFRSKWEDFLQTSIKHSVSPILSQCVSRLVFKELITLKLSVKTQDDTSVSCTITAQEENALRYVAGYVCRKVEEDISKSSLKDKEDMIQLCVEMAGDEDDGRGSEEWCNAIDRGGLWHISDDTYAVFYVIEDIIRHHLRVSNLKQMNDTNRKTILEAIVKNEELLFQWALISASSDDKVGMSVLQRLCDRYLTVRGFAFASTCLELYKQRSKQQVQKSKALRKKLASQDNTD